MSIRVCMYGYSTQFSLPKIYIIELDIFWHGLLHDRHAFWHVYHVVSTRVTPSFIVSIMSFHSVYFKHVRIYIYTSCVTLNHLYRCLSLYICMSRLLIIITSWLEHFYIYEIQWIIHQHEIVNITWKWLRQGIRDDVSYTHIQTDEFVIK